MNAHIDFPVTSTGGDSTGAAATGLTRVWLVDDHVELRTLLASLLAIDGDLDCSRQFASAEAVLNALAHEPPPDVILLDIHMRGQCGIDALRPIKALARSTHVFMLTTFFDATYKARAIRDGASGFLLKSYAVEEIAARIRQAQAEPPPSLPAADDADARRDEAESELRGSTRSAGRLGHDDPVRRGRETVQRESRWRCASRRLVRKVSQWRALLGMLH